MGGGGWVGGGVASYTIKLGKSLVGTTGQPRASCGEDTLHIPVPGQSQTGGRGGEGGVNLNKSRIVKLKMLKREGVSVPNLERITF